MISKIFVYAFLLLVLGLGTFFATDSRQITALIPAFFSVLIFLCGLCARSEKLRKHAMHLAAVLSLIGMAATAKGIVKIPALLRGEDIERPLAAIEMSIMFILSLWFFIECFRSFAQARLLNKSE